jgi:hypothetical protein
MGLTPNDIEVAASFFDRVVTLLTAWLKKALTLCHKFKEAIENKELFYTDREAALVLCWPEMMYTFQRLCYRDPRCNTFFDSYLFRVSTFDPTTSQLINAYSSSNQVLLWLMERFYEQDGWMNILRFS